MSLLDLLGVTIVKGLPSQLSWLRVCMQCRRLRFYSWVRKIPWRRDRKPTPVFLGFPGDSDGKEFTCNAGDLGLIPGLGRPPGEGNGNPFQYSGLENPMDRGAWWATVHGVTQSQTRLSDEAQHSGTIAKNPPANAGTPDPWSGRSRMHWGNQPLRRSSGACALQLKPPR